MGCAITVHAHVCSFEVFTHVSCCFAQAQCEQELEELEREVTAKKAELDSVLPQYQHQKRTEERLNARWDQHWHGINTLYRYDTVSQVEGM